MQFARVIWYDALIGDPLAQRYTTPKPGWLVSVHDYYEEESDPPVCGLVVGEPELVSSLYSEQYECGPVHHDMMTLELLAEGRMRWVMGRTDEWELLSDGGCP